MGRKLRYGDKSIIQKVRFSRAERPSMKTRILQLQTMLEISRILNSTLDLDTLLSVIIEAATEIIAVEAASILLLDEKTGELHFEAATGAKRAQVKSIVVPLEGSIAGWIVRHNEPLMVNDAHQDARHFTQVDRTTDFNTRSILGVPLKVKDKTIGVLEVLNKRANCSFTKQDVETLKTLAAQAAIAIENARLYRNLQEQMQALQQAQARLVQSEKLAAVGELVAGVAHELNNPLTSIMGFAKLLQCKDVDEENRRDLDRIVTQAYRAASIVRGLLDFARQRPPEVKPIQINDVLNSILDLLAYDLHTHNINYHTHLAPNLPLTMADPYQLQQVFVNLINNARQAISATQRSGHLVITTELRSSILLNHQPDTHPVIRIIIQDDGPGIPPKLLSRIFDPFFTTKPVGDGTGLGLSICHGIVSEHGGHIWVESRPGQGATFFVELPIVTATTNVPEQARKAISAGKARILIIDDELDLLDVLTRILEREGYQVDMVGNGEAALIHLARTSYDLILCDIRMPGLSGIEVYQYVQKWNPALARRFLFITGDTISPPTRHFLEEAGTPYLSKPFELSDLIQRIPTLLTNGASLAS